MAHRTGWVTELCPASFPQRRVGEVTFGLQGIPPLEGLSPCAGVRSSARRQEDPPSTPGSTELEAGARPFRSYPSTKPWLCFLQDWSPAGGSSDPFQGRRGPEGWLQVQPQTCNGRAGCR